MFRVMCVWYCGLGPQCGFECLFFIVPLLFIFFLAKKPPNYTSFILKKKTLFLIPLKQFGSNFCKKNKKMFLSLIPTI